MAADVGAVLLAVLIADVVTFVTTGESTPSVWIIAAPILWVTTMLHRRLYIARHISRRLVEFRGLVGASATSLALLALGVFAVDAPVSRIWLGTGAFLALVGLTTEREIARQIFLRLRRDGRLRRAVVVVGGNEEALELARFMDADKTVGYEVVGFVTDTPVELLDEEVRGRLLGSLDRLEAVVEETGALGIVIASTAVTTTASNRLARCMTRAGVHVELSSTLRDVAAERLVVTGIGRFPMLYVEACRRSGWRMVAKRAFDVTAAAGMILLTAPVLLAVALAVRLTSSGPVLFRQTRLGKDGVPFEVLKFRSMVPGAESMLIDLTDRNEADGPLFKMRDDPRVTPVGKLLRRTSLDELPQLWNVVRGEMSLVGPRPALPEEAQAWSPELRSRLDVKPGITGMWQVNGRSSASFDDYVRLDLFYVDNWSLVTDLAILARTVPAVLSRSGAM
jgi:exopolysaccharide biosynthesis polyprenyl glycosylphosphotransferase